jgi:regulator of RNase E activity RraA
MPAGVARDRQGGAGSVLVIDASENPKVNSYGGVADATSKHHGLVGCVTDGEHRANNRLVLQSVGS